MNFISSLTTHPRSESQQAFAIIPIMGKTATTVSGTLKNHPIWLWSVQYARNENVLPIVCTDSTEIQEICEETHVGHLSVPPNTTQEKLITTLLEDTPCDFFFILDPAYPARPRGVLKSILARSVTSPPVSAFTAVGLSGHDTRTFLYTKELVHKKTEYAVHLPDICAKPAGKLKTFFKKEKNSLFDPWYTPDRIAIILENCYITKDIREILENCSLKVYVASIFAAKNTATIAYDISVQSTPAAPAKSDTLIYTLFPGALDPASCDLSGWSHADYKFNVISEYAKAILVIQRLYPGVPLIYYGNKICKEDLANLPAKLRNYYLTVDYTVFENSTWSAITEFKDIVYAPAFDKSEDTSVPTVPTSVFPARGEDVDTGHYNIYRVSHPQWHDLLFIDSRTNTGKRAGAKDICHLEEMLPFKGMCINWEKWGKEYFLYNKDRRVWELCDKEKFASLKVLSRVH